MANDIRSRLRSLLCSDLSGFSRSCLGLPASASPAGVRAESCVVGDGRGAFCDVAYANGMLTIYGARLESDDTLRQVKQAYSAEVVKFTAKKYGWQIKTVDISQQPDLAARFDITVTPTLLLIKQDQEQFMPLSVGVIALSEMEQKLYQAIRYLRGDTAIDSFTTYDYQKGSALDPTAILKSQPQRPPIRR